MDVNVDTLPGSAAIAAIANTVTAIINYNTTLLAKASPEQAHVIIQQQVEIIRFWQNAAEPFILLLNNLKAVREAREANRVAPSSTVTPTSLPKVTQ